jgi:hypothetical protein
VPAADENEILGNRNPLPHRATMPEPRPEDERPARRTARRGRETPVRLAATRGCDN